VERQSVQKTEMPGRNAGRTLCKVLDHTISRCLQFVDDRINSGRVIHERRENGFIRRSQDQQLALLRRDA